jgi:hypothetical protein
MSEAKVPVTHETGDLLLDRLTSRSQNLRKKAAKGRETFISARQLRGIADLLDEAAMFIEGVQAQRKVGPR